MKDSRKPLSGHPGPYIRQNVLPTDLSVTAAAKTLGVGRPALSNLLNGNASLSPEMATRIEKAFGASSDTLLKMQAHYDRSRAHDREPAMAVRSYAPSFMSIKAIQIEAWAERQEARAELAAFLRRLVISTGTELSKADFPAYENSQRKGWDGSVTAGSATPWIPLGTSGWEFGVNQDAARKAEEDYAARTKGIAPQVRADTTFVFVTPRNWPGKEAWAAAKRATGEWKDVRAYDASDLEQWLEASIPAQAWMAERLAIGAGEVQTLDACWRRELLDELKGTAAPRNTPTR
jgi:addiction module HigA family antidote